MEKLFKISIVTAAILGMCTITQVQAQQDYMPPMSGWPAGVQTQWQVQGEYYGSQTQNSAVHLGAWLVAGGGTNYGLVLLPGGLLDIPSQQYGGWDKATRYQGATGPALGTLNGKVFNVSTATGGYTADSITGSNESRALYVHNIDGKSYVLQRVKRHSPTRGFSAAQVKNVAGAGGVISLWDSATGQADLKNWQQVDNAAQVKYNYLFRGIQTANTYGSYLLHIEFLSCFNPTANQQNRANSGIYVQHGYENQVLDNFGLSGALNEYGAIYELKAPKVNAELPPQVTLQTYDIYFKIRTSGKQGDAAGQATETTYANGVLVQDETAMPSYTPGASPPASPLANGPLYLQNHGNEIVFNNIWIVPNATPISLPYSSILATADPSVSIKSQIQPLGRSMDFGKLDLETVFDLTGRAIPVHGKALSIIPTETFNSKKP